MMPRRGILAALLASAFRAQEGKPGMFEDAQAYERFMGRWSSLIAPRLVDFTELPDAGRVLDVGSGTGALTFSIARLKPRCQVIGIDPSEQYVGYASSRNPFPDRVAFRVGDAQTLNFSAATFENSLFLLVFNFIPDGKRALREVGRVTKPGGWVSAAVWDYGEGMRMLRVFWDAARSVDPAAERFDESHMPLCRAGELAGFWRQGGLESVEERTLNIMMRFESFADYWEPFLLGQGPAGAFLRNVNGARRQAVRVEVKRILGLRVEDVPFSIPARAWAVRGTVPGRR